MELDEMKTAWADLGRKLDAQIEMTRNLQNEVRVDKAHRVLGRFSLLPIWEIATGALTLLLLGSFLGSFQELRFVVPAVLLVLFAVAITVSAAWQVASLQSIDYSMSVLEVQRKVALIRTVRLRTSQWIFILSPLLWTPLQIVAAEGLCHVDLYKALGATYIGANIAFGVVAIPVLFGIGTLFSRSRFGRFMADELGGRSLASTIRFLKESREFEAGP